MKKLLIALALLLSQTGFAQQFSTVLNAPVKSANLSDLKGKIVIIDFWATWCGSCIEAMPHLQELQSKYKNQLQIIAVNDETVYRTAQFLKSRPSNLWFAVDTANTIAAMFPHQLIPHDILIGADGKPITATDPDLITDRVIDSLLNHQTVHLPVKTDNLINYEDLIKQNFAAADTVQSRMMIQGAIKGAPGVSTTWLDNKAFDGRRITGINLSLTTWYMIANGNFPYSRVIDSTHAGKNARSYCIDLIVKNRADLWPTLRKELASRFDIQAMVINMDKEVQMLTITDAEKFKSIPRNTTNKRTYYARHGEIDQQAMTMTDLADYLESYGTGKITINNTLNTEKLDIKFNFQPENPQSLTDVLAGMGLALTKQRRAVPMLLLYRQNLGL